VLVEAPVLDRDDRLGEVLAEAGATDRLAALRGRYLSYLLPLLVVDVGVLETV
jgi:hypothetical protein